MKIETQFIPGDVVHVVAECEGDEGRELCTTQRTVDEVQIRINARHEKRVLYKTSAPIFDNGSVFPADIVFASRADAERSILETRRAGLRSALEEVEAKLADLDKAEGKKS